MKCFVKSYFNKVVEWNEHDECIEIKGEPESLEGKVELENTIKIKPEVKNNHFMVYCMESEK